MECGQTLNAGCPNCGFVNLPEAKFCSECGTVLGASAPGATADAAVARPVAQPAPQQQAASSGAERRLVSILFADLVGFTPW